MKLVAKFRSWLRTMLHRSQMERDMEQELGFHLERSTEDLMRDGIEPAEAQRRARLAFGAVEGRKEEMREALGLRLFDELRGDLRYAFRQLRQSPAFTVVAVLSLALGIGANTAIFSLMQAALWKSIPVRNPEELRLLSWESGPRRVMDGLSGDASRTPTGGTTSTAFSYPVFLALQAQDAAFDSLVAFRRVGRVTATIDGRTELVESDLVSGNFFETLGVPAAAGRTIGPADDVRGGVDNVAVVSYGFWTRRFGRDQSTIGKQIVLNQVAVTIVGVSPPTFTGLELGRNPDVLLPLNRQPAMFPSNDSPGGSRLDDPGLWWVVIMGRLKSGVGEAQAQASLDVALQQAVRASLPDRADRDQPHLRLLTGARGLDNLRGQFRRSLLVLLALVGVVLLIACANVANLLLARAAARQREISLRLALGAGRWRVTRQLLTEGLALAFLGGAAGILLGYWMRDSIPGLLATSWRPGPFRAAFDGRVVGISAGLSLATGILFSLAPAWRSARPEINTTLKDASRVGLKLPRWSRGKPLVVFQVCLSVLLLIGAGLFIRTLSSLRSVSLGFEPERVLLFVVDPPRTGSSTAEARKALFDTLQQRIGTIPGVDTVTLSSNPLMTGGGSQTRVDPSGKGPESQRPSWVNDVGYDFFETMGIPILYGRPLNRLDRANSQPVAVVNQQFVREFFPNENPIGKSFSNGNRVLEIVGVAGDSRYDRLRRPLQATFYRAYLQRPELDEMTFEVKVSIGAGSVVERIRDAVRSVDADLAIFDVRMQTEQIDATLSQERLFVALTVAFGALALVLACIGIYGIMANGVARRTNEIGIRIALGAERGRVLWMILREAALLATVGAAIGVALATGLTRYLETMLYGVQPIDLLTMSAAVVLMVLVALLTGWIPARKASRLEPMAALRHE